MSMMPPARLDREPWSAMPMARPAEASTVMMEAAGTPRMLMMATTRRAKRTMRMKLTRKVCREGSSFSIILLLSSHLTNFLMMNRPTRKTTSASRIWETTVVTTDRMFSIEHYRLS